MGNGSFLVPQPFLFEEEAITPKDLDMDIKPLQGGPDLFEGTV